MDYKKRSIKKLNLSNSYEEIDTRLASGWYVDSEGLSKSKKYKTKEVSFKISKKSNWNFSFLYIYLFKKKIISEFRYV